MPIPKGRSARIKHFVEKGRPVKQAVAIAYALERRGRGRSTKKR